MHLSVACRAAAVALLLAACGDSTGSDPMTGVYVAQSVNGRAVPAVLDSMPWNDGTTYTLQRLMAASVEFLDDENARYTFVERHVAYTGADSVGGGSCQSLTLPYRREGSRVVLVVEPALYGQQGPLRLDTLQVQNDELVQNVRTSGGKSASVTFARGVEAADC